MEAVVLGRMALVIVHRQCGPGGPNRHALVQVERAQVPVIETDRRDRLGENVAEREVFEVVAGDRRGQQTALRHEVRDQPIAPDVQVVVDGEEHFFDEEVAAVVGAR